MADSPILTFEVYRDSTFLFREDLSAESITIGKGPAAMLRVEEDALQDLQAVVNVNDDGSVQLLDLVGEGTKVNGAGVVNASLNNGDTIEIGNIRIVVGFSGANEFDGEEATQMLRAPEAGEPVDDEATDHGGGEGGFALKSKAGVSADAAAQAGDGESEEDYSEDVMAFIMRFGTGQSDVGNNNKLAPVLEVSQIWGDQVVDTKHYGKSGNPVTVGTGTGSRVRLFSHPLGWGPDFLSGLLWLTGGIISATPEWKNEFYVPPEDVAEEGYKLFTSSGGSWSANISDKWGGFVDIGEQRHTIQELIESGKATADGGSYSIEITADTRLVIDLGNVVFFAQMVPASKAIVSKVTDNLDYPFLGIMTFTIFLGIMTGILVWNAPPSKGFGLNEVPDRFVELLLEEPPPEPPKEKSKPSANPDAGEGAKAKREEGKVGKKDAKMDRAKGNKVEMNKRQVDKEIAENAGVLGAMRDGAEMDGVFGTSGLNSDIAGGIGGLIGAKGTQIGSGGLGSRGSGLGGGGTAEGLGGLGTKGRGSGSSGYGTGGGNFGAKGEGGIGRIGGDPIILGALDKSLIDQVIKRNMNQIRYCYQRELTKNPALGGKIVVKFVIAKDGSVSSASTKATTMNNKAVENCINGRFMRFKFPEPKGGGIVIVSYPFIFSPG